MGIFVYVLQYISREANNQANKRFTGICAQKNKLQSLAGQKEVYKKQGSKPQKLGPTQLGGTAGQPSLGWLAVPST
jgi:hypothetical protein